MFVRGPNPIWFMSNLTGQPLDDTYYAFFLTNDLPYIPQTVYQDPDGFTPWSDPIEFQPSSGLPNNLYFDPTLVYRIEIRQGPDQTFPLIWLVQNYIAGSGNSAIISDSLITASNMITNPQFSDILFASPATFTTAGTYDIAPGWELVLTGTGTTTLTQTSNDGNSDIVGNPPYYLSFANSGWTTVELIQTFNNNGALFGGGAIGIAFTATSSGSSQLLTVSYEPSTGIATQLFSGSIPTGNLIAYANAVDIPDSTNTDTGEDAFVDIVFNLPVSGTILLTNIQLTGQSVPLSAGFIDNPTPPEFSELTYERIVDEEFHVYKNSLVTQSKENILVGWNFGLNPWQFVTKTITNMAFNGYSADQTIIIQQNFVENGVGSNIATGQGTAAQSYPFAVTAVTTSNQFAMIQYIDPTTIAPYWDQILSSLVNANIVTSNGTMCQFKMRLIYQNGLPATISQNEPILSWITGEDPVFTSGWTTISPINDPIYTFGAESQNFSFNQFQLPISLSVNMTLGIVLYTITNLSITSPADSLLFNNISLTPNDFAIEASVETFDETLRKCQYYYEKSYDSITLPGAATGIGALFSEQLASGSSPVNLLGRSFSFQFNTVKRQNSPTITLYSPDGTSGAVEGFITNNGVLSAGTDITVSGNYTQNSLNSKAVIYLSQSGGTVLKSLSQAASTPEAYITYQYVIDARLGR
jgi:hypothetical protein